MRRLALYLASDEIHTLAHSLAQLFTQHYYVVLHPAYCRTGLGARQGAALPHETGGHDVDDVLGFSRLSWASSVPPLLRLG